MQGSQLGPARARPVAMAWVDQHRKLDFAPVTLVLWPRSSGLRYVFGVAGASRRGILLRPEPGLCLYRWERLL